VTREPPPTPALFTPLQLRGVQFANRIAVSPMAQYSAVDGAVQPWHFQHLGSLAVSGPGLVCIESTSVERAGYGSKTCVALHTEAQEAALRGLIGAIRTFSATPIGIQFGHSGRKGAGCDPSEGRRALRAEEGAWEIWAPSAIPWSPSWPTPREMDRTAIDRVIAAYGQAAERAARLDLSVIELHGAHGYLLHSFLSPVSNRRTDGYGGSLQNRMRLILEVTERVRAAWPSDRVLGIRLNSHDWLPDGLTIDDTVEIARAFQAGGGDYVSISAGALTSEAKIPAAPGYLAPHAAQIRSRAGMPTFVTGMIVDPHQANEIIASGQADMLSIARAFLDDPRWVWHAAQALGAAVPYPMQYQLSRPGTWRGAEMLRPTR
jgi:NADPH2 dehydrogenase